MYFSNMLGDKGVGRFSRTGKRGEGVAFFENNVAEPTAVASIIVDGDSIKVVEGVSDKDVSGKLYAGEDEVKARELADTEENPIIWVLTDRVAFYLNSTAHCKYIYINENMMLFCLVKGVCDIGSEAITLSRNTTSETASRVAAPVYPNDLLQFSSIVDKKTGYNMSIDSVVALDVLLRDSQRKIRTSRELSTVLSTATRDRLARKQEEKEKKKEQIRAEILAQRKLAEQKDKKRRQEEAVRAEGETFGEINSQGQNTSASAFLQMVRGL